MNRKRFFRDYAFLAVSVALIGGGILALSVDQLDRKLAADAASRQEAFASMRGNAGRVSLTVAEAR